MLVQYFIAIISEWTVWITSSIPAATLFCLSIFFPDFMKPYRWIIIAFILLGFVVASYRAWAKEKVKRVNLENEILKLKQNPVSYEVKCESIQKESLQDDFMKLAEEKIFVKREIDSFVDLSKGPMSLSWWEDIAKRSNLAAQGASKDDWENYYKLLDKFEVELKRYEKLMSNIFIVDLSMENTGPVYDEKINIIIRPMTDCEFIKRNALQKPTMPERPKSIYDRLLSPSFANFPMSNYARRASLPFREIQSFSKDYIEIDILELRAREKVPIVPQGICIKSESGAISLSVEIKSKETRFPISLNVSCA
jgi:hypothetical protein